jgi:hypothetical protein
VNGNGKIEILRPLDEAFELMKTMLFRPFDLKKWFVIGFAAFLAGHFAGVGFNIPFGGFPPRHANQPPISPDWGQWKPWLPAFIAVFVVGGVAFIIFMMWLKARGNFVFADCVARNRAAIAEPWREYRREGNSYFLFLLLVMLGAMVLFGILCAGIFISLGVFGQGVSNDVMTPFAIVSLVLLGIAWLCFMFFFALIAYFMVPLMYVRRCRAAEAFRQIAGLVMENAGSFVLFCLFGICLALAAIVIGGVATCATCCLAALPYIGTVILLPVFVCLRAYALRFIRQFGPDYDVWSVAPALPPPLPTE